MDRLRETFELMTQGDFRRFIGAEAIRFLGSEFRFMVHPLHTRTKGSGLFDFYRETSCPWSDRVSFTELHGAPNGLGIGTGRGPMSFRQATEIKDA